MTEAELNCPLCQQVNYCAMKNILSIATRSNFFSGKGEDVQNEVASCFSLKATKSLLGNDNITFKELIKNVLVTDGYFNKVYKVNK